MKKALICLLSACLLLIFTACSTSYAMPNSNISNDSPTEDELKAMYAAEELNINCFQNDKYGGAYRKDTKCIVLLTDISDVEVKQEILLLSSYDDIIVFEECAYSYSYLSDLYQKTQEHIEQTPIDGYRRHYISFHENRVIVDITANNDAFESIRQLDSKTGGAAVIVRTDEKILYDGN